MGWAKIERVILSVWGLCWGPRHDFRGVLTTQQYTACAEQTHSRTHNKHTDTESTHNTDSRANTQHTDNTQVVQTQDTQRRHRTQTHSDKQRAHRHQTPRTQITQEAQTRTQHKQSAHKAHTQTQRTDTGAHKRRTQETDTAQDTTHRNRDIEHTIHFYTHMRSVRCVCACVRALCDWQRKSA